jgi:hypothetical protein
MVVRLTLLPFAFVAVKAKATDSRAPCRSAVNADFGSVTFSVRGRAARIDARTRESANVFRMRRGGLRPGVARRFGLSVAVTLPVSTRFACWSQRAVSLRIPAGGARCPLRLGAGALTRAL